MNGDNAHSSKLRRSHTDWEGFKSEKDSETSSNNSEPSKEDSNAFNSLGHLQSEAAIALGNCHKIARRKFLLQKEQQLKNDVHFLTQLIGRSAGEKLFTGGKINEESLTSFNTATIQVIVNDFHTKIENLNEELVHLVIEKDELQVSS